MLLTSCTRAKPAPTFMPFPTPVPPTATSTPIAAVGAGTPLPLGEVSIDLSNLGSLSLLARWGKGRIIQVALSAKGEQLAVATPLGIYLYDAASFAEHEFIEVGGSLTAMAYSPDGSL